MESARIDDLLYLDSFHSTSNPNTKARTTMEDNCLPLLPSFNRSTILPTRLLGPLR